MMAVGAKNLGPRLYHTALKRFRRNRLAVIGACLLAFATAMSLGSLPFSLRWYNVQGLELAVRHAPSAAPVIPVERFVSADGPAWLLYGCIQRIP